MSDNVNHPKHYHLDGLEIEAIDVIRSVLGGEKFRGYCRGNILKYLIRADSKNKVEDLKKAKRYLEWEIEEAENNEEEENHPHPGPMTNADVIRSMTDEELDIFLAKWEVCDIPYEITFCDLCLRDKDSGGEGNVLGLDCDGCRKHWLKSDATPLHNGLQNMRERGEFNDTV